jgi:hypothetical protein
MVLILPSLMRISYFYATGIGILQALISHVKFSNQFSFLHFWGEVFLMFMAFLDTLKIKLQPAS